MHDESDAQLLREYAEHGNEAAFREIVGRHTDLVPHLSLKQFVLKSVFRAQYLSIFHEHPRRF